MLFRVPLGWFQLRKQKLRLLVAITGVAFAVTLISMQLGFRRALFDSAVRYHRLLDYDLVLVSPETQYVANPQSFPRRRLYQAAAFPGVSSVSPVYMEQTYFKNPFTNQRRRIFVVGFDPDERVLDLDAVDRQREALKLPDVAVFDATSRPEFGPVAEALRSGGAISTEVGDRAIDIVGLFEIGTSFGIDGSLITSDLNFLRLFPERPPGLVDLGLIRLEPRTALRPLQNALEAGLDPDVLALTKPEYMEREIAYWNSTTPIGFVFAFGAAVGLMVGGIIVYQILFADVTGHLPEYATLKAIGYPTSFLFGVVLQEAVVLAVLGYVPGVAITFGLYRVAAEATKLPIALTLERGAAVLALTIGMCCVSGLLAVRKIRSADPAEVF